jgi:uncharacterized membrane protein
VSEDSADPPDDDPDEAIPAEIVEVAEAVGQRPEVVERIVEAAWAYSGPLPPPSMLRGYDAVIPGAAERILSLAEREATHRHWLDRTYVNYRFLGLALAAVIAFGVIGGGIFLIHEDKSAIGLALILGDLALLAGVFVVQQVRGNGGE